ncbi:MAG: hypothetical protein WC956_03330 [bacterium]
MEQYGISVVEEEGISRNPADVSLEIAQLLESTFRDDCDGIARAYGKAASLCEKARCIPAQAHCLQRRSVALHNKAQRIEWSIFDSRGGRNNMTEADRRKVQAAYGEYADASGALLRVLAGMTIEQQNEAFPYLHNNVLEWFYKGYAEALRDAGRLYDAAQIYGLLAARWFTHSGLTYEELQRRVTEYQPDPFQFLGSQRIFGEAYENISKRVELLGRAGRFRQIAEDMAAFCAMSLAAELDPRNEVEKYIAANREYAEIALVSAAAGARYCKYYDVAAEFESRAAAFYSASHLHSDEAEALRRAALDLAHDAVYNWTTGQFILRTQSVIAIADTLGHYRDAFLASGGVAEDPRIIGVTAIADQIREFFDRGNTIALTWVGNRLALVPLVQLEDILKTGPRLPD